MRTENVQIRPCTLSRTLGFFQQAKRDLEFLRASSEGPDQTARARSLIRAFAIRVWTNKDLFCEILSYYGYKEHNPSWPLINLLTAQEIIIFIIYIWAYFRGSDAQRGGNSIKFIMVPFWNGVCIKRKTVALRWERILSFSGTPLLDGAWCTETNRKSQKLSPS